MRIRLSGKGMEARVRDGGLQVTVSEDTLCEAIERAYGLPEGACLESIFGTEGQEIMLQLVRYAVVDAIDEQLRDVSIKTIRRYERANAAAGATATA